MMKENENLQEKNQGSQKEIKKHADQELRASQTMKQKKEEATVKSSSGSTRSGRSGNASDETLGNP